MYSDQLLTSIQFLQSCKFNLLNNPLTTSFTLEEMAELNGVVRDAHQIKADKLKLQCQVIFRDHCIATSIFTHSLHF